MAAARLHPAGLRLVVPPLAALAFASLPRWARRLYGAPGSPLTDLTATVAVVAPGLTVSDLLVTTS